MRTDNIEFIWDGGQRIIIRQDGSPYDEGRLELFCGDGAGEGEHRLIDAFDVPQQRNWLRMLQLPEGARWLNLISRGDAESVLVRLTDKIGPPGPGSRPVRRVLVAESLSGTGGQPAFELKSLDKVPLEGRLSRIIERYQTDAKANGRHPFWWLSYEELGSKTNGLRELQITPATGVSGDASLRLICEYVHSEDPRRDASGAPTALALHAMREPPYTPKLRIFADHGGQIPEAVRSGLLFFHIHKQLVGMGEAGRVDAEQETEVTISHEVASNLMGISLQYVAKLAPASGFHKTFLHQALEEKTATITSGNLAQAPRGNPKGSGETIEYAFFIACYGDEVGVVSGTDVNVCPAEDRTRSSRSVTFRVVHGRGALLEPGTEDPAVADLVSDAVEQAWGTSMDPVSGEGRHVSSSWQRSLRERVAKVIGEADGSRDLGLPDGFQGFDVLSMTAYTQAIERAGSWLREQQSGFALRAFLTFAAFQRDPVLCGFLCDNAEPGRAALNLERPVKRATGEHPAARILNFFGRGEALPPPKDDNGQVSSLDWLRRYDLLERLRAANVTMEDYASDSAFLSHLADIEPLLKSVDELRKLKAEYERRGRDRTARLLGAYAEARNANQGFTLGKLVRTALEIKESNRKYETAGGELESILDSGQGVQWRPSRSTEAITVTEARARLKELIPKVLDNPQVPQVLKDKVVDIDLDDVDLDGALVIYEKLLDLGSGQPALTFTEVVAALENWARLPSFVRQLPKGSGEALDEDQDARARLAKWLENAQRGLPRPVSGPPANHLADVEAQIVARLKARIGRPNLRVFDDANYDDLVALSRILVFHRGFEALHQLSSELALAEQSHYLKSMHADNAKLRRFLCCWPSRAAEAWKLAEELADRSQDSSIEQLRATIDASTLELQ
jgi:hypothetical protein